MFKICLKFSDKINISPNLEFYYLLDKDKYLFQGFSRFKTWNFSASKVFADFRVAFDFWGHIRDANNFAVLSFASNIRGKIIGRDM